MTCHMASPSMGVHTVQYMCDIHERQLFSPKPLKKKQFYEIIEPRIERADTISAVVMI